MKTLLKFAMASLLAASSVAQAQDIQLPIVEAAADHGIELSFDADTKLLEISYTFIASNSCARAAKNVKTKKGLIVNEVSFNIGLASSKPGQICLMVLRPQTVVAKVRRFEKSAILSVAGESKGVLVLSEDGQSVTFEANQDFTTQK